VRAAYRAAGVTDAQVSPFIDDMAAAYRDADLVVCRAGATSIAELTVCGRPAILVPFPGATDDHQTANAKALEATGAAIHLRQSEALADDLARMLESLDGNRLTAMAKAAHAAGRPHAAAAIADALEEVRRV
jgi:UDP-N-acetylglucosamine--N-acetylmuramyl-(pentapeptide) pyrophosphoryl-undecaprenol N-acetylglucosamine transferase